MDGGGRSRGRGLVISGILLKLGSLRSKEQTKD